MNIDRTPVGADEPDSLTYDPTQEAGTDAWQRSVQANLARQAKERRN